MQTNDSAEQTQSALQRRTDYGLAAGLLPVVQQAAALRLALALLAMAADWPTLSGVPLGLVMLSTVERALLLAAAWLPAVRRTLGRQFLPLVLVWLLTVPQIEWAVSLLLSGGVMAPFPNSPFVTSDTAPIWLVVPVALAAWQYQRNGLRLAIASLVAGHTVIGILAAAAVPIGGFVLVAAARLATLTLLGYVVRHLSEAKQAEQAALEEANRQLAQRAATVEQLAESRERNRLARELHDTLAHSLTGLSVQLQALETLMANDPQAAREQLHAAQGTVRSGVKEARRAIQSLRATPLQDLGLAQALREMCRAQAERTGVAFQCDIAEVLSRDPLTEQTFYRVAAAALANVEQHAAASQVTVNLQAGSTKRLLLVIADNGVGFDATSAPADRFGLAGMAERAALIGASLRVESGPGKGTRVELLLPS